MFGCGGVCIFKWVRKSLKRAKEFPGGHPNEITVLIKSGKTISIFSFINLLLPYFRNYFDQFFSGYFGSHICGISGGGRGAKSTR